MIGQDNVDSSRRWSFHKTQTRFQWGHTVVIPISTPKNVNHLAALEQFENGTISPIRFFFKKPTQKNVTADTIVSCCSYTSPPNVFTIIWKPHVSWRKQTWSCNTCFHPKVQLHLPIYNWHSPCVGWWKSSRWRAFTHQCYLCTYNFRTFHTHKLNKMIVS